MKIYDQVFCDSYEALKLAYNEGLNKNTIIRTSSPWMINLKKKNIIQLEKKIIGEKLKKLQNSISPFTIDIYKKLINTEFKNEALLCAINSLYYHRLLKKAACLSKSDYYKKNLIIQTDSFNKEVNELVNPKWERLFLNKNTDFKTYRVEHVNQKNLNKTNYSKLDLLNIYSKTNIIFFIYKKLSFLFNIKSTKKYLLIFREDHLTREISKNLIESGASPIFFKNKVLERHKFSDNKFSVLKRKIQYIIFNHTSKFVDKLFCQKLIDHYFFDLKNLLNIKKSNNYFFNKYLNKFKGKEILAISSYPATPQTIALAEELRKKKTNLVSTQHGINREINETYKEGMINLENNVSEILFVKNKESKKVSMQSPFSRGKCEIVGVPSQFLQKKRFNLFNSKKKIFYISTRVSSANLNMLSGYLTDYEKLVQERNLVKKVLNKVNKKIIFKTYPHFDYYLDADLVHKDVEKSKNLELLNSHKDIQFFFTKMSLIITSRATSTLSWCLFSNIPLIFINYPNQHMVKKKAYNLFKKSLIFFDANSKNFYKNLRDYLSKPLNEIKNDWLEKELARKKLMHEYISTTINRGGAGKAAVNYILKNKLFRKVI